MVTFSAVLFFNFFVVISTGGPNIENFDCYPNQTIRFTNPNTGLYTHFKAFYDNVGTVADCAVTTDDGNNYAYLDCSSTTATVTLYISARNLSLGDSILYKDSASYTFQCQTVDSHNKTLSNDLTVNISKTSESKAPQFNITSDFFDESGNIVTEATVGETVYYIIKGPSQYDLQPLQCNGTGSLPSEHTTLIANGCSQDSDLIDDFSASTQGLENHYNATLYVFKFYNSETLTISCMIEVCTTSGDCSFSCNNRRKRSLSLFSRLERELDDDMKISTVGNTLRILEPVLGGSTKLPDPFKFIITVGLLLTSLL